MIDPSAITTTSIDRLPEEPFNLTDLIIHSIGADMKQGTIQQLADFLSTILGTISGVGFRAISVNDGETLPETTQEEFILVGPGTFINVGGGANITTTEELNALVSNGTYWFIGVEIPINVELAGITQEIRSGFTDTTPSEDAIFNALAGITDDISSIDSAISNVMHLSGNESFTGIKSSTISAITSPAISISNPFANINSYGIYLNVSNVGIGQLINLSASGIGLKAVNNSSGDTIYVSNGQGGNGINISNTNTGNGINTDNSAGVGHSINNLSSGIALKLNNSTSATGKPFQYTKNSVEKAYLDSLGAFKAQIIRLTGYTVSTLPSGTIGDTAYVSDAVSPTYLSNVVGGGSVVCKVFYNGSNWICN